LRLSRAGTLARYLRDFNPNAKLDFGQHAVEIGIARSELELAPELGERGTRKDPAEQADLESTPSMPCSAKRTSMPPTIRKDPALGSGTPGARS